MVFLNVQISSGLSDIHKNMNCILETILFFSFRQSAPCDIGPRKLYTDRTAVHFDIFPDSFSLETIKDRFEDPSSSALD